MASKNYISTPENANRIAGMLKEGKKVLIRAPRQCGKTELVKMVMERAEIDLVVCADRRAARAYGAKGMTYEEVTRAEVTHAEVQDTELYTGEVIMVVDEPFYIGQKAWVYCLQDKARLYIGTSLERLEEEVKAHCEDKFDVVEKLGFDEETE